MPWAKSCWLEYTFTLKAGAELAAGERRDGIVIELPAGVTLAGLVAGTWLNWRCGISLGAVAKVLEEHPQMAADTDVKQFVEWARQAAAQAGQRMEVKA